MKAPAKWRFAIGTTSRVPGSSLHYLMLDVDNKNPWPYQYQFQDPFKRCIQETKSGFHIYTSYQLSFAEMLYRSVGMGADPAWARIAQARGYAFLADKAPIALPWPVERMVIGL
jgi:hypothetical protein